MGTVSSDVILNSLSPEAKKRVKAKTKAAIKEIEALSDIRKQLGYTQNEVARTLKINQKNVSSVEARSDMLLSTLQSYIEALGCELEIVIKKPDETRVKFSGLMSAEKCA